MNGLFQLLVGTLSSGSGSPAPPGNRNITSVEGTTDIIVEYGTQFEFLPLPSTRTVTLHDGTTAELIVLWEVGSYDPNVDGEVTLEGILVPTQDIENLNEVKATVKIIVESEVTFDYFVRTAAEGGSNSNNGETEDTAFLSINYALSVAALEGGERNISVGEGTFIEFAYLTPAPGVSLYGRGKQSTIIKLDSSLNHTFVPYSYSTNKYMLQMVNGIGNQIIKGITFEGNARAIHGGAFISNRSLVAFKDVEFINFGFNGMLFSNSNDCSLEDVILTNTAYSQTVFSSGALMVDTISDFDINNLTVDEDAGYGIKGWGPPPASPTITRMKIRNSNISVTPETNYGDGTQYNMAIEFHNCTLVNNLLENTKTDGTVSLVRPLHQAPTGIKTFRIHNHHFDQETRALGAGYALELGIHNVEIDHCYFNGGDNCAIGAFNVNETEAAEGWDIHHNVFHNQQGHWPSGILLSLHCPFKNVNFYNNTIDIPAPPIGGNRTVAIFFTQNGQVSQNVKMINCIVNDESTGDALANEGGPNSIVRLDGGGGIQNFECHHNIFYGIPQPTLPGGVIHSNTFVNPQLTKSGLAPIPYYRPLSGSPAIAAGVVVGLPYTGAGPTIGAYEVAGATTEKDITGVVRIPDRVVPSGIAFASLGLPTNVTVNLSDTTQEQLPVEWAQGSYDSNTQGIYTLVGSITPDANMGNPESITASIVVIVVDSVFIEDDSFNRDSLGGDYVVAGTGLVPTLDDEDMTLDTGPILTFLQGVFSTKPLSGVEDIEVTLLQEIIEHNTGSHGLGAGIKNAVDPNPNRGVIAVFDTSTNVDGGSLKIFAGNGSITPGAFSVRSTSAAKLPVEVGEFFETKLRGVVDGSNTTWTAYARNTTTNQTITTSWVENGNQLLAYRDTSQAGIWYRGGNQKVSNFRIQDIDIASPFPDVEEIDSPANFSVPNGTVFGSNGAGVGLPATVQVTLSDASTPTYNVTWALGSYSPTTAGPYTILGTLTLPGGVTNMSNLQASVIITVQAPIPAQTFTYYVSPSGDDGAAGNLAAPFRTGQRAANILQPGQSVAFREGTYRETIVPTNSGTTGNPITYSKYPGENPVISGLDILTAGGWSQYSGNIYRKPCTLPVNGHNTSTSRINENLLNTTIFANNIFRNGEMLFEARWPKVSTMEDLFQRNKFREPGMNSEGTAPNFQPTYIDDATLPIAAPGLVGSLMAGNGWLMAETRIVTGHSGIRVSWPSPIWDNTLGGKWTRQRYYFTNKLSLLTQEKEWHYQVEGGQGYLYLWQPGGGSPTGTYEYRARNHGFDCRNKSNITIAGLTFKGVDAYVGNSASVNTIIDNIRSTYTNHFIHHGPWEWQGVGMAKQFGIKLLGNNSVIKNSEISYSASQMVWLGPNCKMENCYLHHVGWAGYFGNPVSFWGTDDGQKVLWSTFYYCGRSCVDFGFNFGQAPGTSHHYNTEVAYNKMSWFGYLGGDTGGNYVWGQCDLWGGSMHHNWIWKNISPGQWNGVSSGYGIGVGIYFDQSTGPYDVYRNVCWDCGDSDVYHETINDIRPGSNPAAWTRPYPLINFFNNTFATNLGSMDGSASSYRSYITSPKDPQRNNIYKRRVVVNWNQPINHITNSILPPGTGGLGPNCIAGNPTFVGGGTEDGLAYRLAPGSIGINAGAHIPGLTDGYVGSAPDIGAYETGGEAWVPGYVPVEFEEPEPPVEGEGDITSLGTVSNISVPYNTQFGTNGSGLGLPQTVSAVLSGTGPSTVGLTWAIGSYSLTAAFFTDTPYTLIGTPIETSEIHNPSNFTVSCQVTVLSSVGALDSEKFLLLFPNKMATNTNNAYGQVESNNDITRVKHQGVAGRDFINNVTKPKFSTNKALLVGTGGFIEEAASSLYQWMSYDPNPANVKATVFMVGQVNDTNKQFNGIMGNNGFYNPLPGFCINHFSDGATNHCTLFISGGGGGALTWGVDNMIVQGQEKVYAWRWDLSKAINDGRVRGWTNGTPFNATAGGTGVLTSAAVGKLTLHDMNTGANLDMEGSNRAWVIVKGAETDAKVVKFMSDLAAFTGLSYP